VFQSLLLPFHPSSRKQQGSSFLSGTNTENINLPSSVSALHSKEKMRTIVVLLITLVSFTKLRIAAAQGEATVRFSSQSYTAAIASFGYQFNNEDPFHEANLMMPPNRTDPFLCSLPQIDDLNSYRRSLEDDNNIFGGTPIALFVSRGGCTFEQKARNALYLQVNVSSRIKYVHVYNSEREEDSYSPSAVIEMGVTDKSRSYEEYDDLGLIFLSTRTGKAILTHIKLLSQATRTSPYFMEQNSTMWELRTVVVRQADSKRTEEKFVVSANMFYVLRFVLFSILLVSPCIRAGFLWFGGGGRIRFRRSEEGRITGLVYISPVPHWFARGPSHNQNNNASMSDCLTEEQVLALPEIVYQRQEGADDLEPEVDVDPFREQLELAATETAYTDVSEPRLPQVDTNRTSTTCTSCSICIDDFEDGETVRLLPRCGHAFHTDCIMPWLTERQGCCPLCKDSVLGSGDDVTEVENSV